MHGVLIGSAFLASIDIGGKRTDKENCALIVQDYKVIPGYKAYIIVSRELDEYAANLSSYCPDSSILYAVNDMEELHDYDVIEVNQNGRAQVVYRDLSGDNVLFITNKCNSNCIMCPDSDTARKKELPTRTDYILKLIDLIPEDTHHLTITGGEPTLLKWDLLKILSECKEKFHHTDFLMLSNGRTLCVKEYRDAFLESVPLRFQLAVPLYGDSSYTHDAITRSPGGFVQTISALKYLQNYINVEIRIVIMRQTYSELPKIADYIVKNLPNIKKVSLMGIELLGNAALRRNELWIDYTETVTYLENSINTLISSGIEAQIYNYPLCNLPRNLWGLAVRSITDYKVRYKDECSKCSMKDICGGFFFSTLHFENIKVYPVPEDN